MHFKLLYELGLGAELKVCCQDIPDGPPDFVSPLSSEVGRACRVFTLDRNLEPIITQVA